MYNARIETTAGAVIRLGYKHGIIFDISPLSGVDVTLATSQGFQQIGETVENQSVKGVSRTIRGTFLGPEPQKQARALLRALPMFASGRLVYDDRYFCNVYVQKTPYVTKVGDKYTFSMMLYCDTPYWLDMQASSYVLGGYTAAFSFPVAYDVHIFGTKNDSAFTNCINTGAVDVPMTVRFVSSAETEGFGLININTLEELKLNMTLHVGETVTVSREGGRLQVMRGEEDVFSALDENSDLYWIHPGDNVLRMTADSGLESLQASLSYNAAEIGVV